MRSWTGCWRGCEPSALDSTSGRGRLKNASHGIYDQGGKSLLLPLTRSGNGYAGSFDIGVKLA